MGREAGQSPGAAGSSPRVPGLTLMPNCPMALGPQRASKPLDQGLDEKSLIAGSVVEGGKLVPSHCLPQHTYTHILGDPRTEIQVSGCR